jgi:pumilio family protein 6
MTLALQPILEKGIVDHSIIHRAIVEYLSISKKVRNVSVIFVLEVKLFILWHSKFWGLTFLHWLGMQSMIQEVVQQLSGALLVRMLHTRDGAKVGVTCVMHGSNKVSMVLL